AARVPFGSCASGPCAACNPRNFKPCWRIAMSVDAELARWGEPPVSDTEEALMAFLDNVLEQGTQAQAARPESVFADAPTLAREGAALVQAAECLEQFVDSVLEYSRVEGEYPPPPGAETEIYPGALPDSMERLPDPFPGDYRVKAFLGEGKFSRVWLA